MSEPVTALQGRASKRSAALISDAGLTGMITLRGDLADGALRAVCQQITSADFPARGKIISQGAAAIGWMSPDEVLLMLPYDGVSAALAQIEAALAGQHFLAVDVSDARALIHLEGAGAREILAKLSPADLRPDRFGAGDLRRSHLGQVAAAFWMLDEQRFAVICFRSVADYMFDLLDVSARAGRVGHF